MQAEGLDLDLAERRGPAAAGARRAFSRHQLFRHAEPRAGCAIVDQPPADGCLGRLGGVASNARS